MQFRCWFCQFCPIGFENEGILQFLKRGNWKFLSQKSRAGHHQYDTLLCKYCRFFFVYFGHYHRYTFLNERPENSSMPHDNVPSIASMQAHPDQCIFGRIWSLFSRCSSASWSRCARLRLIYFILAFGIVWPIIWNCCCIFFWRKMYFIGFSIYFTFSCLCGLFRPLNPILLLLFHWFRNILTSLFFFWSFFAYFFDHFYCWKFDQFKHLVRA